MEDNKKNENFSDTIVIDSSLSDNQETIITIHSSDLQNQYLDDNYSYKVSPDGNVIASNLHDNSRENKLKLKKPKELLMYELVKYGFEKIPFDLTEIELKNILEFSMNNIEKNINFGKVFPFSVEKEDTGDLKITFLVYNGNRSSLNLSKLPVKLKDAKSKVIFADLMDLNKEISPKKIGICYVKINKETLKEDSMDLTTWTITFEP